MTSQKYATVTPRSLDLDWRRDAKFILVISFNSIVRGSNAFLRICIVVNCERAKHHACGSSDERAGPLITKRVAERVEGAMPVFVPFAGHGISPFVKKYFVNSICAN
jgi:hypothetical protein